MARRLRIRIVGTAALTFAFLFSIGLETGTSRGRAWAQNTKAAAPPGQPMPVLEPPPPPPIADPRPPRSEAALEEAPRVGASPAQRLLQAVAAQPWVAPYAAGLRTFERGGRVVLQGRVGTRSAYDSAVRAAIDTGIRFSDELKIDTSLSYLGAEAGTEIGSTPQPPPALRPVSPLGLGIGGGALSDSYSSPFAAYSFSSGRSIYSPYRGAYPYPPPWTAASPNLLPTPYWNWLGPSLLGPDADLLFVDPPIISYPPDWRERSARRLRGLEAEAQRQPPLPLEAPNAGRAAESGPDRWRMRISAQGVAELTGGAATQAEKIAIAESVAKLPGVRAVINNLAVDGPNEPEAGADAEAAAPPAANPVVVPPPPNPNPDPNAAPAPAPASEPEPESEPLSEVGARVQDAVRRLPDGARLGSRFRESDGAVTLTGTVASSYEAMLLFRAVQTTPGVLAVHDQLRVSGLSGDGGNPLKLKGKPEEVEPYLDAQLRRHLNAGARIELVQLNGDSLTVRGSVRDEEARERAEAALRLIPVLRGFRLDPQFVIAP